MKKYVIIASLLLLLAGALYFFNQANEEKDVYDGVLVENNINTDLQEKWERKSFSRLLIISVPKGTDGSGYEERYFVS